MKLAQSYLMTVWALALIVFICYLGNIFPQYPVKASVVMKYAMSLTCLFLTFAGGLLAVRLFTMREPVHQVHVRDKEEAMKAYIKFANIRTTIIALAIIVDLGACLIIPGVKGVKYYFLCALLLSIFCWPSKKHFTSVREGY